MSQLLHFFRSLISSGASSKTTSKPLDLDERLSRFLKKQWIRADNTVRPDGFLPFYDKVTGEGGTSVFCTDRMGEAYTAFIKSQLRSVHATAILKASKILTVRQFNLELDERRFKHHVNILGWEPKSEAGKAANRALALKLCSMVGTEILLEK